ncbi:MAG: glycosyltransferase family 4 protein [Chloroflexi bacterium]|nr:glycosyltransferase family 4 protein [Chloroflexota bacterium]
MRFGRREGHPPRIAIVRHLPYPADVLLRRGVLALREAGFDVDVICDYEPGRPMVERDGGVTVLRVPPRHGRGGLGRYAFEYAAFPLVAALAIALRSLGRPYRWVEVNNPPDWLLLAGLLPKLYGAGLTWYCREDMDRLLASDFGISPGHPAARLLRAIERMCSRVADRVIVTQELARRDLIRQGVPADKVLVIPNGPDERITRSRAPRPLHEEPADADGHRPFRLVTHGTLVKRYGVENMIEAVALLRDRIPTIQLEVLGEGEYRPELERLAERLGLGSHVTFTGWLPSYDDVAARLARADIGLVALWTDFQLCIKLTDYLALGLPVITTESAALRPYLDDGEVCYVEPRNARALADAILALYRDPERRAALAAAGHAGYLEHFAWDRVKHDYLAVYSGEDSGPGIQPQEVERSIA